MTIIVTSDLSDRSQHAIARGIQLAQMAQARLMVIHVVDNTLPEFIAAHVQEMTKVKLSEDVAAIAGPAHEHQIEVTIGDTVEEITKMAEMMEATLLVVGLHRRRVFLDSIKETMMERLIRASALPVLLVADAVEGAYKSVLAGVAMSPVCGAALRKIQIVAPKAKVQLFHAHETSFEKEARLDLETWSGETKLPKDLPEPILFEGPALEAIRQLMTETKYDLLAIGGHTRSVTSRYILGSVSADLIRKPPCDLLIAK